MPIVLSIYSVTGNAMRVGFLLTNRFFQYFTYVIMKNTIPNRNSTHSFYLAHRIACNTAGTIKEKIKVMCSSLPK